MVKEVRQKALEKYKSHILNSWIISIICGLFIAALVLVGILSEALTIILVPFLILPFFFACAVSHVSLREKDELTGGNLFAFYRLFFRPPFFSSFSAIKSFLKAFLVALVISFVSTGICYFVFSQSGSFQPSLNQLIESVSNMTITDEQYQLLLEANDNELANFFNLTDAITFMAYAFGFIFFILREEITIYIRLSIKNIPLAGAISRASIKSNSGKFNKLYFALNWPLLLIMLVGMVGGTILSILVFHNYSISGVIGLSVGLALSSTFLPFYFANMEAIFEELAIDIASFSEQYLKDVFNKQYGFDPDKEQVEGTKKDSDKSES